MTKLNCKPGDLAVVITAHNPENIGTILRVIKKHHNQDALVDSKELTFGLPKRHGLWHITWEESW